MNTTIEFIFRNKQYSCLVYVDNSSSPYYAFVELQDDILIAEFGNDISRLPKKDDYPALVEIRESIFIAIKDLPEFIAAPNKRELLLKGSPGSFEQHAC